MAQTLLIGLGGTGSRVVNNVVKELHKNGKQINDGQICCAVLDTNVNDNESIVDSNTGVPVVPTSKAMKIRDYFAQYHHLHMETWCPQAPAFMEESMIDGASELRMKSRVAFMDCLESGVIDQLELMINEVLRNNAGSKIRIMIVSSLSGGTGSGMFIQVALWLRKFLSESEITIRGIFLLPDVFVSTVRDIRDNKTTSVRHYCNAYAAIRELNALSKIMKGNSVELAEPIVLGKLFDSRTDSDFGKPVYDLAFFVDDKDENGVRLESIGEYERMVAQLVYMQLYAPMKNDMYSEEDNFFLTGFENEEPLYGSCGTSKAVYPVESVKTYCAIRGVSDSLTGGWKKIDAEIDAAVEERKQAEKDGIFASDVLDIRKMFIKLFDEKTAVSAEETGKDRFFLSISKDPKNETRVKSDGDKVAIKYTDKVEDFIKLLKTQKIDVMVTRHSGTEDYALNADTFVSADHSKEELASKVTSDAAGLEEALDLFDSKVEEYADEIVGGVFPLSMGEVKATNRCTIYGLLTKQDDKNNWNFIHPVAARYVLYKLVEKLEKELKTIVLTASRSDALTGGDLGTLFDNKATAGTESDPLAFLNSKRWYQSEGTFLDDFEGRYAQFITSKIALCEKYQKECLQAAVYRKLIARLNGMITHLENFFRNLNDVQQKLDDALAENISETNGVVGKTMFVYGSAKEKESIYRSLDFELDRSNVKINKSVIDAIYGSYCAEKRPSNPDNMAYAGISVINAFVQETIKDFRERIDGNAANSENVNLDIFTALCRSADAEFAARGGKDKPAGLESLDVATGQVRVDDSRARRHKEAFTSCASRLLRMAAPFLIHDREVADNDLGTVTTRPKTFWGFSPDVAESCPYAGTVLGVNADLQADDAYPKNELYCYRAVYGMEAVYIPKFNELKGGNYYTCYDKVVSSMIEDADGRQGERALVRTPHLDKNWHRLLPYITAAKQKQDNLEFFKGFWLAIAYGILKTNKDGNVVISRCVGSSRMPEEVPVMFREKPVSRVDVVKLITALRADKVFTGSDLVRANQRFNEELEELTTYVGTDAIRGLTSRNEDLNPINVVARYHGAPRHDKFVTAALIEALEMIAGQLATSYNEERSEKELELAKFKICRRIYDSSTRTQGRTEVFGYWEEMFRKLKISGEAVAADETVQ